MKITERRCDHCACPIPSGIEYLEIVGTITVLRDHATGTRAERFSKLGAELCGTTCLHSYTSGAKDLAKEQPLAPAGSAS